MSYLHVTAPASIHVPDYKNLLAAWRLYGGHRSPALVLVGSFTVEKPLTQGQRRRLPAELRWRLA